MQVIGLCRFSYPAIGGFQVEHETVEDRIAFLYEETRLEERFRLLETVALPCLKEQTDPNFDLVIVIGDQLPKPHVDRLHDVTSDMPQVQVQAHPPERQRQIMKRILNDARRDPSKPCLQFRYDDDDAVSVDFIRLLRETTDDVAPLCARHRSVGFDWAQGYVAEVGAEGISATQMYRHLYVASLGMYVRGDDNLTIMNFAHERLNRFMPVISNAEEPMWVRTHNGFNDSRQKKVKPVPVEPLTDEQKLEFAARFAMDEEHIKRVFSA
ncbi:putative rhamnosyl transferase [Shimia sediminis]|uniref:putative rhamnosyl transferase n=1 Tax=Shimia sediminis TaxID=2497945 RepID=UPI000F8C6830|nr:putative rhamnosyl transferase [Shimia sediminis]